jgi:hypothetical protein
MKKKMTIVVLAMVLASLLAATTSMAVTPPWYVCTVNATGQSSGGPVVNLTDNNGAFANVWFYLDTSVSNPLLATCLTSLSATLPVVAFVYDTTGNTPLSFIYSISGTFTP